MFKNHKKKNNFFIKNHKAQVGETMTWIVATLVIIVLLTISVVIAKLNFNSEEIVLKKSSDLISVKSISGFLSNENNLNLIKDSVKKKDYTLLELEIKTLLDSLPKEDSSKWNFQLTVNEKEEFQIFQGNTLFSSPDNYEIIFKFKQDLNEIVLEFWEGN